eukprot:gnl/MRDRNA2_/MRDRNA2_160674_c0_seq1.p1 gnl/MRDRNA2_/MRDRNA2_160674_c0~~gnl/MRDRNA2_/MRDRNA2_160674_c0_seq1.p1  ORF type:complete len:193 (+),score=43.63 gnl/MRDRNA2_/MRDRNA2_160674_c0_seq1:65-643(+)
MCLGRAAGPLLTLFHVATADVYGKPPCKEGEEYVTVLGRVVCTTQCGHTKEMTACPPKPKGAFADTGCILSERKAEKGHLPKMFCGLVCTANSYCPSGARCAKPEIGKKTDKDAKNDNPEDYSDRTLWDTVSPYLMSDERLKGVCTYKAATKKKKVGPKELKLALSFQQEIMDDFNIQPAPGLMHELRKEEL